MSVVSSNSEYLTSSLADKALDAFWEVVVQHCPTATTGDLSIDRSIALQTTAEAAIREWIANNVPGAQ